MSNDTKYFLIPASSGLCIQPGWNKTETVPLNGDDKQLWKIEQSKKNKFAFRNADSGDYLRAAGGSKSNAVKAGARQWWTLESSDTPYAFWIKCDDFPNAYLCNSYGNITPNNTIYMWSKEEYWTQTMLWYLFDYDSWSKHRKSKPDLQFSNPSSGSRKGNEDLEVKLKEAEDKQNELEQKLKAAEGKYSEAEKESTDWQKDVEKREEELAERGKEFESKQEAASAKEKELEARERAVTDKEAIAGEGNDESGGDGEELKKLREQIADLKTNSTNMQAENDRLKAKEAELAKLKQSYAELNRSKGNDSSQPDSNNDIIIGRRLQPSSREAEAARVGLRDKPLGLRTRDPRPTTTNGRLAPVQLQQSFSKMPRLREG